MLLTNDDIEFLADGIAIDDFSHDLARRVERVVVAKLCAGVAMPEPFRKQGQQMAYDGDDKVFFDCFSADQLRAYGAAQRLKALEDAAMLATPLLPRPCDCEVCDCGNSGDYARVIDWDSSNSLAKAIRALKGEA